MQEIENIDSLDSLSVSESELVEQLSLYSLLISVDTFSALGSGAEFIFDESEIADIIYPPAAAPTAINHSARQSVPTLAKNTIWENSPFACLYDESKEFSIAISRYNPDARSHAQFAIQLSKFFRRIVRFSRENTSHAFYYQEQRELHEALLQFMIGAPVQLVPFKSLAPFLWGANRASFPPFTSRQSADVVTNVLVILAGFACLHLSTSQYQSGQVFAVEFGGPCLYSSGEIMYAITNLLAYTFQVADSPIAPHESVFGYYPYHTALIQECFKNGTNSSLPSPVLSHPFNMLLAYIVSSSAWTASSSFEKLHQAHNIALLVSNVVYPTMVKVSNIWPGVASLVRKLDSIINNRAV
jgi:hypothetical protein